MTVAEQFEDATYFLNLLSYKTDRKEARALTSAILAISRSIPDHLLEEYNVKLGLNISLTDQLRLREFTEKAKLQNNNNALQFSALYKQQLDNLFTTTIWNLMKEKRDIKIHRNDDPLRKQFEGKIKENLKLEVVNKVTVYDTHGNVRNNKSPNSEQSESNSVHNEIIGESIDTSLGGVKWFFNDEPNIELVNLFDLSLNEMRTFVATIRSHFP
jgi:hypothetical protein